MLINSVHLIKGLKKDLKDYNHFLRDAIKEKDFAEAWSLKAYIAVTKDIIKRVENREEDLVCEVKGGKEREW